MLSEQQKLELLCSPVTCHLFIFSTKLVFSNFFLFSNLFFQIFIETFSLEPPQGEESQFWPQTFNSIENHQNC
jgi:hypothetical protein